jgi:hypothetical protein
LLSDLNILFHKTAHFHPHSLPFRFLNESYVCFLKILTPLFHHSPTPIGSLKSVTFIRLSIFLASDLRNNSFPLFITTLVQLAPSRTWTICKVLRVSVICLTKQLISFVSPEPCSNCLHQNLTFVRLSMVPAFILRNNSVLCFTTTLVQLAP